MNTDKPTLLEMIIAARYLDNAPPIQGFNTEEALLKAIRRVVDVIRDSDDHTANRYEISQEILHDAGVWE